MNHSFGRTHINEDVDDVSEKRKQKRAKDDGHDTHSLTLMPYFYTVQIFKICSNKIQI